jgi:hypothetical protein
MHLKHRNNRAYLYRTEWVPRGREGNTHGFSRHRFVASLPVNSTDLPLSLRELLSADEQVWVERAVLEPARASQAAAMAQAEQHERDPRWRIEQASALINQAVELSKQAPVPKELVSRLREHLQGLTQDEPNPAAPVARHDPLGAALAAIREAAAAVESGHYGRAPQIGMRQTWPHKAWMQIHEAVAGTNGRSLLRTLQNRGFAKARSRAM